MPAVMAAIPLTQPCPTALLASTAGMAQPRYELRPSRLLMWEPKEWDQLPIPAWLKAAYLSVYSAQGLYKRGHCHDNVRMLVARLKAEKDFDAAKAKVLMIFRYQPRAWQYPLIFGTQNLVLSRLRGGEAFPYLFHIVLEYEGYIYDLSFGKHPMILKREQYFREAFLRQEPFTLTEIEEACSSRAMKERIAAAMNHARMSNPKSLNQEIRIRTFSTEDYLEDSYPCLIRSLGTLDSIWHGMEKKYPSIALDEYLEGHTITSAALPQRERSALEYDGTYELPGEVTVYYFTEVLARGDMQQTTNAIQIKRPEWRYPIAFNHTDRGWELLRYFYPQDMIDPEQLRGQVILESSCGGGLFVEELRERGIEAYGLDVVLSPRQRERLHTDRSQDATTPIQLTSNSLGIFILADSLHTGLSDQQVDIIYETYGLFYYRHFSIDGDFLSRLLLEWKRLLRIGGCIRIAPLDSSEQDDFRKFLSAVPGLELHRMVVANPQNDPYRCAVELVRTS